MCIVVSIIKTYQNIWSYQSFEYLISAWSGSFPISDEVSLYSGLMAWRPDPAGYTFSGFSDIVAAVGHPCIGYCLRERADLWWSLAHWMIRSGAESCQPGTTLGALALNAMSTRYKTQFLSVRMSNDPLASLQDPMCITRRVEAQFELSVSPHWQAGGIMQTISRPCSWGIILGQKWVGFKNSDRIFWRIMVVGTCRDLLR